MRMFGAAFLVAAAPLFATCGDAVLGPEPEMLVVLEAVGGMPLPAAIEEAPGAVRVFRGDTITFLTGDRWSRVQVQGLIHSGSATQEFRWDSHGTLLRDGTVLVLDYECHDTASCVAPDRLLPDGDGFRIERQLDAEQVLAFRYRVVPLGEGAS